MPAKDSMPNFVYLKWYLHLPVCYVGSDTAVALSVGCNRNWSKKSSICISKEASSSSSIGVFSFKSVLLLLWIPSHLVTSLFFFFFFFFGEYYSLEDKWCFQTDTKAYCWLCTYILGRVAQLIHDFDVQNDQTFFSFMTFYFVVRLYHQETALRFIHFSLVISKWDT